MKKLTLTLAAAILLGGLSFAQDSKAKTTKPAGKPMDKKAPTAVAKPSKTKPTSTSNTPANPPTQKASPAKPATK